jgi:hypothetical protein
MWILQLRRLRQLSYPPHVFYQRDRRLRLTRAAVAMYVWVDAVELAVPDDVRSTCGELYAPSAQPLASLGVAST